MTRDPRFLPFCLGQSFFLRFLSRRFKPHDDRLRVPTSAEASVWRRVDAEVQHSQGLHDRYWWKHSGYILAVLLYHAGYSAEAQYRNLRFFANAIASSLGVTHSPVGGQKFWPSFMTDDGVPIELSWDWGTGNETPTVRYSIEPVGLHAGTPLDHHNQYAASKFHQQLLDSLPGVRLEWFDHFKNYFYSSDCFDSHVQEGHSSQIFYAFDLLESKISSKAYFFPAPKAARNGQTNLAAISHAITTAPYCTTENLQSFSIFHEYALDPCNAMLELDMLAIDLIDPMKSRLKIYLRSRETTFNSVTNIMTLGGRAKSVELDKSLEDLRSLWDAVLEVDSKSDAPLRQVDHRTAGILYNVEFRLGSQIPSTKIYIPVRHYASNDTSVIRGLNAYLRHRQRDQNMANYVKAMSSLFSQKAMQMGCGLQTYVGCSTRKDGSLRVVSYLNPQTSKLLTRTSGA